MSQPPYGSQDPNRSGNYEDYSQGYSSAPQQPAPGYGQAPYTQPTYGQQPPQDPYGQPAYGQPAYGQQPPQDPYAQPAYGQPPYAQPGYAQGYAPQTPYGMSPYAPIDTHPRPSVTMVQAVKLWLKNWKNFSGRASRSELWWTYLAVGIVQASIGIVMLVIIGIVAATSNSSDAAALVMILMYAVLGVVSLVFLVPNLSLAVRRLHDTNQSGWLYLVAMIPYVGGIALLILLAQKSNPLGARFDDASQPLYGPENL